jgi:hypothetical protein
MMIQQVHIEKILGLINKVITLILSQWISKQLLLRSILIAAGVIPLLFVIGYITLYGLYFGGAKSSILSLAVEYVPFNRFACVAVGLLLTGLTAFIWWIYVLFRDRRQQKLKLSLIVLVVTIFLIMLHGHLLLFFVTQDFLNIDTFLKFSLIWTGPVTLFIILSIMKVVRNSYGLVLISSGITFLTYIHLISKVSVETFYPFIIIGIGISTALLKKGHKNGFGVTWFFTLIITVLFIIGCKSLGLGTFKSRGLLLLSSIVLSYVLARVIYSIYQKKRKLNSSEPRRNSLRLRFSNILDTGIYYWSVVILLVAPLMIFILFSTGSYIRGNVISNDNDYIYISTPERTLVIVRPGGQSVIVK